MLTDDAGRNVPLFRLKRVHVPLLLLQQFGRDNLTVAVKDGLHNDRGHGLGAIHDGLRNLLARISCMDDGSVLVIDDQVGSQYVFHISTPMMMAMMAQESSQYVFHISTPMMMAMMAQESRQMARSLRTLAARLISSR